MNDVPQQIGKYRIEHELGRGAMGVVYQAYDLVVERQVALKTIHVPTGSGVDFLDILRREAKSVGRFEHPNIVTLFDAGEIDGVFCMVMQLVDGESLRDLLQRQRWFKVTQVVDMFRQVLAGLGYAHQRGVIHRDIKPANILIHAEGIIKLADFGIAKLIGPSASASGVVVGTPSYMSPEQVLGRAVDARSDIFAVGCTLYEVLTGEKAYQGDSASSVMYRIVHESPAPPARLRPGTHPGLEAVVLKALANDPADRYATCIEMAKALEDCLEAQPTSFKRMRPALSPLGRGAAAPRSGSVRWWLIGALAVATLAVAVLLVVPARKPSHPMQPSPRILLAAPQPSALLVSPLPAPVEAAVKPPAYRVSPPVRRPPQPPPRVPQAVPPLDEFTATLLRGDVAFQQSAYDSALAAYLKADALKPGDPGVRRKLRVVLTLLGRVAEARAYQ